MTIDRLVLGGVHFPIDRIAVGSFRLQTARGLSADGLLGADILLAFDMDIDVPEGKLHALPQPGLSLYETAVAGERRSRSGA